MGYILLHQTAAQSVSGCARQAHQCGRQTQGLGALRLQDASIKSNQNFLLVQLFALSSGTAEAGLVLLSDSSSGLRLGSLPRSKLLLCHLSLFPWVDKERLCVLVED